MTVADLIKALGAYPADMPVVVRSDDAGSEWSPPALDRGVMSATGDGWFINGDANAKTQVLRL